MISLTGLAARVIRKNPSCFLNIAPLILTHAFHTWKDIFPNSSSSRKSIARPDALGGRSIWIDARPRHGCHHWLRAKNPSRAHSIRHANQNPKTAALAAPCCGAQLKTCHGGLPWRGSKSIHRRTPIRCPRAGHKRFGLSSSPDAPTASPDSD